MGWLARRLLGIAPGETGSARRGFIVEDPAARGRLERIGEIFLEGYHGALEAKDFKTLIMGLNVVPLEMRGFAFEGAGMGLAIQDDRHEARRAEAVAEGALVRIEGGRRFTARDL